MKKLLLVSIALAVTLFAGVKEDIEAIDFISKNRIVIQEYKDMGSFYVVKGEINARGQKQIANFFVSKDKKAVIFGKGYTASGEEITIPVDVARFKGKEAVKIGGGKNEYFVFTDPECPYCKRFEEMIREKNLTKNNTFYFFLYPLASHKEAVPMSLFILSKESNEKRWEAMEDVASKYKKVTLSQKQQERLQKELDAQMQIANEIGIRGTPTVFDGSGKNVDWTQIQ